jgi:methyl-accepting chemotaxis protein
VEAGSRLVGQAGSTMTEVVSSVQRVTHIMAGITAANQSQSAGIERVNQSIVRMDEVTQQNAAMVEEAASAAQAMQDEAHHLSRAISVFKLGAQTPHTSQLASARPLGLAYPH